jgi:hypothetical protein
MFFAKPGDFFNGHPLSSFCESCRLGILEIGRTERLGVTLCAACTAMMAAADPGATATLEPSVIAKRILTGAGLLGSASGVAPTIWTSTGPVTPSAPAGDRSPAAAQPELPPQKWALTTRGARPATAAELAGIVELHPAEPGPGPAANDNLLPVSVEHPLPWRWIEYASGGRLGLADADGKIFLFDTLGDPVSPYVRAVTERAGFAFELLRRVADGQPSASTGSLLAEIRAVLAEVDAASRMTDE